MCQALLLETKLTAHGHSAGDWRWTGIEARERTACYTSCQSRTTLIRGCFFLQIIIYKYIIRLNGHVNFYSVDAYSCHP